MAEILPQIASDINKSKCQLSPTIGVSTWKMLRLSAGDQLLRDIQSWLSPPDPWKNYNGALRLRHGKTGTWFVNSTLLSEWKVSESSSLLWIHAKRQLPPCAKCFAQRLMVSSFHSGCREDRSLVRLPFGIFVFRSHSIRQFCYYRGYRDDEKIWARITRHILL